MVPVRDCVHLGLCPFEIVSIRDHVHSGIRDGVHSGIRDCVFRDHVQDPNQEVQEDQQDQDQKDFMD